MSKSEPLPEGTVILAEEQYAGRGQRSNGWVSEPGKNLTCSILLKPHFLAPDRQFILNKLVCVALNTVLEEITGSGFSIKWPNDIYFENAKIGGVLIENMISGRTWKHAIIGIGMNVNQENFPPPLSSATSLIKILHRNYSIQALLSDICRHIEACYLQLKGGRTGWIEERYLEKLYRKGTIARYRLESGTLLNGMIEGVDESGRLRIKSDGVITFYDLKEIEFLND